MATESYASTSTRFQLLLGSFPLLTCVSFMIAVAEVEASDVHTGIDELFDSLNRPTGGPHCADDLRAGDGWWVKLGFKSFPCAPKLRANDTRPSGLFLTFVCLKLTSDLFRTLSRSMECPRRVGPVLSERGCVLAIIWRNEDRGGFSRRMSNTAMTCCDPVEKARDRKLFLTHA